MSEVVLNPDQAKRLSELIETIPKPLPAEFEEFANALSEASDIATDSAEGLAYIDITVQAEED